MLRKLLLLPVLMSTSAFAIVELENGDASNEANLCIEAVMDENFKYTDKNERITCNGLLIKEFVKKYRTRMQEADDTKISVYQLEATNNDVETQLCVAAAGGKQKMITLAKQLKYSTYNDVMCNGKNINEFARDFLK